jgi:hypothetical protein
VTELSPAVIAAIASIVDQRVDQILHAASERLRVEGKARLRRGHDHALTAGWQEAADWQDPSVAVRKES